MSTRSSILLADNEANSSQALRALLEQDGHRVTLAPDGEAARHLLETDDIDLLIAELVVPACDGFGLLKAAHQVRPSMPVILMSQYGTVETAVRALRQGAYHYFQKPLDTNAVRAAIAEALSSPSASPPGYWSVPQKRAETSDLDDLGIVGRGPWLEEVLDLLRRVAPTRATVLLAGESGTGKELFARAIHRMSGRKGPFVAVSCAALSRDLLESELFGHEKGSFTGADRQKPGRFELADGGTLLLDEIGDVPTDLQVKLLRVLQERQFERVGGTETLKVDVRIVAATNRDLATAIHEGTLREDLYYRLKVVEIALPPLRERPDDVEPLARHFAEVYAAANRKEVAEVGPSVLRLLERHPWPGNVRELENSIERAVVLAEPGTAELDPSLLPETVRNGTPTLCGLAAERTQPARVSRPGHVLPLLHQMEESERVRCLSDALQNSAGNATHAAKLLGVSPRSVRYYADKYGLARRGGRRTG